MGYWSDVCLCLSRKGWEFLMDRLDNESEDFKELFWTFMGMADNAEGLRIRDGEKVIEGTGDFEHHNDYEQRMYFWENVKWYDWTSESFREVWFIKEAINQLAAEDVWFDRMGEEDGDREQLGEMESVWHSEVRRHMVVDAWI